MNIPPRAGAIFCSDPAFDVTTLHPWSLKASETTVGLLLVHREEQEDVIVLVFQFILQAHDTLANLIHSNPLLALDSPVDVAYMICLDTYYARL